MADALQAPTGLLQQLQQAADLDRTGGSSEEAGAEAGRDREGRGEEGSGRSQEKVSGWFDIVVAELQQVGGG